MRTFWSVCLVLMGCSATDVSDDTATGLGPSLWSDVPAWLDGDAPSAAHIEDERRAVSDTADDALTLDTLPAFQIGSEISLSVTDATPDSRVFFLIGKYAEDHACPELLDGRCMDLERPRRYLGEATANSAGVATLITTVPDTMRMHTFMTEGYSAHVQTIQASPPQVSNALEISVCDAAELFIVGGTCTACSNSETCVEATCEDGLYDANTDLSDGCESTCPADNPEDECGVCGGDGISDGACDCDGTLPDECGVCFGDGIPEGACDCDGTLLDACGVCGGDGECCEEIEVTGGSCTDCADPETCTELSCDSGAFDDDGDASNGCEAGCPSVANGTCTGCADSATCTEVTCDAGHISSDDGASCIEIDCPIIGSRSALDAKVDECLAALDADGDCEVDGCPIGNWDISAVTDLSSLFWRSGASSFNAPIGAWDTSNVTTTANMFRGASSFNQDIGTWDVRNVTHMNGMFMQATAFNQDIGGWNTESLNNISSMFQNATTFNQDLSCWDLSNISGTTNTFLNAFASECAVINVAGVKGIYCGDDSECVAEAGSCPAITDSNFSTMVNECVADDATGDCVDYAYYSGCGAIGTWDVSAVTQMTDTFYNKGAFNADISGWDTSSVTHMQNMFRNADAFDQDIGGWDVGNVTNMGLMFWDAAAFNQDIGDWDVGNVTNFNQMFRNTGAFNQDLSCWDVMSTSQTTNMFFDSPTECDVISVAGAKGIYCGDGSECVAEAGSCPAITDSNLSTMVNECVGDDVTGDCTDYAFYSGCGDIGTWDVSAVTQMTDTFYNKGAFNADISGWDTSSVTHMQNMFRNAAAFDQNIGAWDVGNVTNMGLMFWDAAGFNQDLSAWDVSNVSNFNQMFRNTANFNQDLSCWDLSSATNTTNMFYDNDGACDVTTVAGVVGIYCGDDSECVAEAGSCPAIDNSNLGTMVNECIGDDVTGDCTDYGIYSGCGDIGTWDVSAVTAMSSLFYNKGAFNADISAWDTSNVTNMNAMFRNADAFDQNIGAWDVGNVTNMGAMFRDSAGFNQDIGDWDVGSVTTFNDMFYRTVSFNQDLSCWDLSSAINTTNTFFEATANSCDMITVAGVKGIYCGDDSECVAEAGSCPAIDNSNLGTMVNECIGDDATGDCTDYAFYSGCGDISTWDVSAVTAMTSLFYNKGVFNADISGWDTSNVTNMNAMFRNADAFDQNIGAWDVGNVTNMGAMFRDSAGFNQDIGDWDVGSVTTFNDMFYRTVSFDQDLSCWDLSSATTTNNTFFGATANSCDVITVAGVKGIYCGDDSECVAEVGSCPAITDSNLGAMVNECVGDDATGDCTDYGIYSGCGDIGTWDVSAVTAMTSLFYNKGAFNADISGWDTANVTNMNAMFRNADAFNQNIGAWDVGKVTNMGLMFRDSSGFNQDIGDWDVGSVTNFNEMFRSTTAFNQDLSCWDLSSASHTTNTFFGATANSCDVITVAGVKGIYCGDDSECVAEVGSCPAIDNSNFSTMVNECVANDATGDCTDYGIYSGCGDIGTWDVSAVTAMSSLFYNKGAFNADVSGWDTSNVTNMNAMFRNADAFDQNIGAWDVGNVTNMGLMFRDSAGFNQDIGDWDVGSVTNFNEMFRSTTAFNQDLSCWDLSSASATTNTFYGATANSCDVTTVAGVKGIYCGDISECVAEVGSCPAIDNGNFSTMVNECVANDATGDCTDYGIYSGCGDIGTWDVSAVTAMNGLFQNDHVFNADISGWDTSNVTTMNAMFRNARAFNQDIGAWDVGNVTNMGLMFRDAWAFNQNIGDWDVGSVTNFNEMFRSATAFDQDVSCWDLSSATHTTNTFYGATANDCVLLGNGSVSDPYRMDCGTGLVCE